MGILSPTHLIIILVIVLIIFGPSRLPQLGKSLGKTMKAIREGSEGKVDEDEDEEEPKAKAKAKAKAAADDEAAKPKAKATSDNEDLEDEE
jgi:sec-independent protein translocase protein TatA